jgi:hypothetical protein
MAYVNRFSRQPVDAIAERKARRDQERRDRNAEVSRGYLADIAMDGTTDSDD